jgi:spore coat polysaccharide biosynthesis predicted glycosyltransferase SpsG
MACGHLNQFETLLILIQNSLNTFRILLICHISSEIGIGHLSRLLALAQELIKNNNVIPEFLIFGDFIKKDELSSFNVHTFSLTDDFIATIENILEMNNFDALIFDLYPKHNINNLGELFIQLKRRNICLISIDSLIEYCNILDLVWIPSFNFDCNKYADCTSVLKSGWGSFLIQKRLQHKDWTPGIKVLILTGGSDVANLGETLPAQLNELLDKNIELHWVKGPFSSTPNLPKKCRLNWVVHNAPEQLDGLIVQSDYVMTVFGVSFFEVLQYGIPTVVFSPYEDKDNDELDALSEEGVAMVVNNPKLAIEGLIELMNNDELAKEYSMNALKKMSINGVQNFSKEIYSLIGLK